MWRAILPYVVGASIPFAVLAGFLAWEFSCDNGAWAAEYSICDFWLVPEFWVSRSKKVCTIVKQMPDGKTQVMVGATSYPTWDEARAARKVAKDAGVCVKNPE